jgi:hypothetical protein
MTTAFALHVREADYPCGNIFAVFLDRVEAVKAIKDKFPGIVEDGQYWCVNDKESTTIEIVEFPLGQWVRGSVHGCAGCMSVIQN